MNVTSFLETHRNIINYGVIGVSAMAVDVACFLLFYNVFQMLPVFATVMSVTIAMVFGFTLNAYYNFKTKDQISSRFLSYAFVSMLGMIASALIIEILVNYSVDPNIAKMVSLPPIVVLQYIFNKTFAFKATV